MYCKKCGNKLSEEERFCSNCGAQVENINFNNNIPNTKKSTIREARNAISYVENFIIGIFFSIVVIASIIPAIRKNTILAISLMILLLLPVCEVIRSGYYLFEINKKSQKDYSKFFKILNVLKWISLTLFIVLLICSLI